MTIACTPVLAGEVTGRIDFLQSGHGWTADDVYVLVRIDAPTLNPSACATDQRFAINPTTNAGKVLLALLTTAHASGANVYLVGTGNCNVMAGFESLSWMRVLD